MFESTVSPAAAGPVSAGAGSVDAARGEHPVLPAQLLELLGLSVSRADATELVDMLSAVAQAESRLTALKACAIKALVDLRDTEQRAPGAHPSVVQDPIECVAREEVAAALTVSCSSAAYEVRAALQLCSRPRTLHAMSCGELSVRGGKTVVEATFALDCTQIAAVEHQIIHQITGKKPVTIRQITNRAVHALFPQHQAVQHQAAVKDRRVGLFPAEHGMATIEAHLPCHEAQLVFAGLTTAARTLKEHDQAILKAHGRPINEAASLGNYRADALLALVRMAMADSDNLPTTETGRKRAAEELVAHVVLDLPTALGLADHPGELQGYGTIPADLARELAADATWQRWITDDTGSLANIGTHRYRPSERMRAFIHARDQHCRFPGCHQPAQHCDLDHVHPFGKGGTTDPGNLGPLCRRHHRIKTHAGWDITDVNPDGTCTWTSPTGQRVHHDPATPCAPRFVDARYHPNDREEHEPPPEDNPPEQPTPAWPDHLPLPDIDLNAHPPDWLPDA